jgi:hypothetical protein
MARSIRPKAVHQLNTAQFEFTFKTEGASLTTGNAGHVRRTAIGSLLSPKRSLKIPTTRARPHASVVKA